MSRSIALVLLLAALAPERAAAADLGRLVEGRRRHRLPRLGPGHAAGPRRGRRRATPGVLLPGLPAGLDDDSLRVEGKGTARARVGGVSVERITQAELALPEVRAAEARLEQLQGEDRALEDRISQARARSKFVESLRASYSEERSKNLAVRGVSAREWADLMAFVETRSTPPRPRCAGRRRRGATWRASWRRPGTTWPSCRPSGAGPAPGSRWS